MSTSQRDLTPQKSANMLPELSPLSRSATANKRYGMNKRVSIFRSSDELNSHYPPNQSGQGELTRKITKKFGSQTLELPIDNEKASEDNKIINKFYEDMKLVEDTESVTNYFNKKNTSITFDVDGLYKISKLNITNNLFVSCQIYILLEIIFKYLNIVIHDFLYNYDSKQIENIIETSSISFIKHMHLGKKKDNMFLVLYLSIINTKYYCNIKDDTFVFPLLDKLAQSNIGKIDTPFIYKSKMYQNIKINNHTPILKENDRVLILDSNNCFYSKKIINKELQHCQGLNLLIYYVQYLSIHAKFNLF
jgi:hypothetical protein